MLLGEFERIFDDIFERRADTYKKIIRSLCRHHYSAKELSKELGVELSGVLSEQLSVLESSEFIRKDYSWKFDGRISRISRYRLRYVEHIRPKITQGLFEQGALEQLPEWQTVVGLQFENLVLNNIAAILDALQIDPASVVSASPFIQNRTLKTPQACQIDLLIHTTFGNLYLCEIKFRQHITADVYSEVEKKIAALRRPKYMSVRPVLIYAGELDPALTQSRQFAATISFEDLLKIRV
jgi:hypothetical protein